MIVIPDFAKINQTDSKNYKEAVSEEGSVEKSFVFDVFCGFNAKEFEQLSHILSQVFDLKFI